MWDLIVLVSDHCLFFSLSSKLKLVSTNKKFYHFKHILSPQVNGSVHKLYGRWKDGLGFYVIFNSSSVISGRYVGDNERLCATKPRVRLKRSSSQAGLEPGTARSAGQCIIH